MLNFGTFGFLEILESYREKFVNFGTETRRGDCHPSVDRSCLIKGHGLSTGGDHIYIYIYIPIYI